MNGLDTETIVMVCLLATVAGGSVVAFLGAVLWELAGDILAGAVLAVWGFLRHAFRDIVDGLKNVVEWVVYGQVYGRPV